MNPSLFLPPREPPSVILSPLQFRQQAGRRRPEDPYSPKARTIAAPMPLLPPVTTTTFPEYRVTAAIPSCLVCIPHPPGLFPPPKSREAVGWNQIYRLGH